MTLKELSIEHDYYAHTNNHYSNEPSEWFETWKEFYEEYGDANVDLNLIFRWDVFKADKGVGYYMRIIIIQQRKGIYKPISIDKVEEDDVPQIKNYLRPHFEKLVNNWRPLSVDFLNLTLHG